MALLSAHWPKRKLFPHSFCQLQHICRYVVLPTESLLHCLTLGYTGQI